MPVRLVGTPQHEAATTREGHVTAPQTPRPSPPSRMSPFCRGNDDLRSPRAGIGARACLRAAMGPMHQHQSLPERSSITPWSQEETSLQDAAPRPIPPTAARWARAPAALVRPAQQLDQPRGHQPRLEAALKPRTRGGQSASVRQHDVLSQADVVQMLAALDQQLRFADPRTARQRAPELGQRQHGRLPHASRYNTSDRGRIRDLVVVGRRHYSRLRVGDAQELPGHHEYYPLTTPSRPMARPDLIPALRPPGGAGQSPREQCWPCCGDGGRDAAGGDRRSGAHDDPAALATAVTAA